MVLLSSSHKEPQPLLLIFSVVKLREGTVDERHVREGRGVLERSILQNKGRTEEIKKVYSGDSEFL